MAKIIVIQGFLGDKIGNYYKPETLAINCDFVGTITLQTHKLVTGDKDNGDGSISAVFTDEILTRIFRTNNLSSIYTKTTIEELVNLINN